MKKIMKLTNLFLKRVIVLLLTFICLFNLTSCNEKRFEDKSKSIYENYIMAAKKQYEKKHGKNGTCRYANVIAEFVNTREQVAQTNSDADIATFVVMLVYETEKDKYNVQNYICRVPKFEFEKIVKKYTEKETHFIKDAVDAADNVNKNRLKAGSIELDVKTGEIKITDAINIGAFGLKTDIGKIYDTLGDTTIGAAAGIEKTLNTLRNSKIKESQIIDNMTDATYYYSIGHFSKFLYSDGGIKVIPISEEELKKSYLDKSEVKIYEKMKKDNGWGDTNNDNNDIKDEKDERSKYEKYLDENGIEKVNKNGYKNRKTYFCGDYKIEVPSYYKLFGEESDLLGYTVYQKGNDNAVLIYMKGNLLREEDITDIANYFINELGANKEKFEIDGNNRSINNDEIDVSMFSLISNNFYSKIAKFFDSDSGDDNYVILYEYLDGKTEYIEDFEKICEAGIKKIKDDIRISSSKDLLDGKFPGGIKEPMVENVYEYFNDNGFANIKKIPKFDVSDGFGSVIGNGIKSFGSGNKVQKDYVYKIEINSRDFDGTLNYREDDEVVIYYHDYVKNKNNYYEEEKEDILVDAPDLSVVKNTKKKDLDEEDIDIEQDIDDEDDDISETTKKRAIKKSIKEAKEEIEDENEIGDNDVIEEESEEKIIKIGVFEPITGELGGGGRQEKYGIEYANKVYNKIDLDDEEYTIELIFADNNSDKETGVETAQKLIDKGVVGVIGSYGSGISIAAGDVFKEAKVPAIACSCTNPQVTAGKDYYFRTCFLDPFQGTVMANYVRNNDYKKVAIISNYGDDYSEGLGNFFKKACELYGIEIACDDRIDVNNDDYDSIFDNIKNINVDFIYVPIQAHQAKSVVTAAREKGIDAVIGAGDTWDNQYILNEFADEAEGIVVTSFYEPDIQPSGEEKIFIKGNGKSVRGFSKYLDSIDVPTEISAVSALGYDAYLAMYKAIESCGSTNGKDIKNALKNIDFKGVTNTISFDKDGNLNASIGYIKKFEDGEYKLVDRTIVE